MGKGGVSVLLLFVWGGGVCFVFTAVAAGWLVTMKACMSELYPSLTRA